MTVRERERATVVMWLELCLGCASHLIVVYMQYNEEFFTHTRERARERERERERARERERERDGCL